MEDAPPLQLTFSRTLFDVNKENMDFTFSLHTIIAFIITLLLFCETLHIKDFLSLNTFL